MTKPKSAGNIVRMRNVLPRCYYTTRVALDIPLSVNCPGRFRSLFTNKSGVWKDVSVQRRLELGYRCLGVEPRRRVIALWQRYAAMRNMITKAEETDPDAILRISSAVASYKNGQPISDTDIVWNTDPGLVTIFSDFLSQIISVGTANFPESFVQAHSCGRSELSQKIRYPLELTWLVDRVIEGHGERPVGRVPGPLPTASQIWTELVLASGGSDGVYITEPLLWSRP